MIELERTFLIKHVPAGLQESLSKKMCDLYIPANERHPHTRIRQNGDAYEFTKKRPIDNDPSKQIESTVYLTKDEFDSLKKSDAKQVSKQRYFYGEDGYSYEVDVFEGPLKGLVLVDIEFENEEAQAEFIMPDWCLREVTHEECIAGGMLAGKSYADIEHTLEKLRYRPIDFMNLDKINN